MTLGEIAVELVNTIDQLLIQRDNLGAEHIVKKRLEEVVEAERQACAKTAEEKWMAHSHQRRGWHTGWNDACKSIVLAIRKRAK